MFIFNIAQLLTRNHANQIFTFWAVVRACLSSVQDNSYWDKITLCLPFELPQTFWTLPQNKSCQDKYDQMLSYWAASRDCLTTHDKSCSHFTASCYFWTSSRSCWTSAHDKICSDKIHPLFTFKATSRACLTSAHDKICWDKNYQMFTFLSCF